MSFLYTSFVMLLLSLFSNVRTDGKNNFQAQVSDAPSSITVIFKLAKRESCIFDYTDSLFEGKRLEFSNSGDIDTSIVRTIFSDMPVSLTYNSAHLYSNNEIKYFNYTFIALPGDTLYLSFSDKDHLNIVKLKRKNILSDNSIPYYTRQNSIPITKSSLSDNEAWLSFYSDFTKQYNTETERIHNILAQGQIDSATFQRFLVTNRLHYYKMLFFWLFTQNGRFSKYCLPVIRQNIPEVESVLNNKYLFATNELLAVMDDLVRAKLLIKGQYGEDDSDIYNEALISNLGKFKPGYLTVCIVKASVKTGAYQKILSDYRDRYKGSMYVFYTDSVLRKQSMKRKLSLNDMLVTMNGVSIAWDDLIKSKGKFVVIDFWTSWCIPCRQQLPYLDSIKTVLKDYPIEFVSVNVDRNIEDWKTVSRQVKYFQLNNYHLVDGKNAAMVKKLNFKYVPRYIVLNGKNLLSSDFTQPSDPSFVKELKELIKKE